MNNFLEMMPARNLDHADGLSFESHVGQDGVTTTVTTGKVAGCVLNGMRRSIATLASSGDHLIDGEVIFGNQINPPSNPLAEYKELLKPNDLHLVEVFAKLEVLERSKRIRGDRTVGPSRWQIDRVHDGMTYDFSVHTDDLSPQECAEQIRKKFEL